jgi:hypothetical protein
MKPKGENRSPLRAFSTSPAVRELYTAAEISRAVEDYLRFGAGEALLLEDGSRLTAYEVDTGRPMLVFIERGHSLTVMTTEDTERG